jgi:hypothetical protein
MRPATGLILRRVGLLIEMACVLGFAMTRDSPRKIGGTDARQLLLAGAVVGLVVWIVGLAVLQIEARRRRQVNEGGRGGD